MLPYYYSLNEYLQHNFGTKMYKLALDAGMTCPNRDGRIGTDGCIFCSLGGSGDFAARAASVAMQIEQGIRLVSDKYKGSDYIAYFQSYTNTYAPVNILRELFTQTVNNEHVRIISIATRPDCLPDEVCELLAEINSIKPVWIELGLQTSKPSSAVYIRRGYDNDVYSDAITRLKLHNSCEHIVTHMIIGLPGESTDDMLNTARYITMCGSDGIKLQLLHVLDDTKLADDYRCGKFNVLTLDEYVKIVEDILMILPPSMVIHRITGDGPKKLLIAPEWSADKKNVLNTMNRRFKEDSIAQGQFFRK